MADFQVVFQNKRSHDDESGQTGGDHFLTCEATHAVRVFSVFSWGNELGLNSSEWVYGSLEQRLRVFQSETLLETLVQFGRRNRTKFGIAAIIHTRAAKEQTPILVFRLSVMRVS